MKNVFNNSELAHVYASNTQSSGRNANESFYFQDGTIYSYGRHFPIAKRVNHLADTYVFTTRSYSNSTAKQIGYTRQALRHARLVYCNNPDESIYSNVHHNREIIERAYLQASTVKYPEGRGKGQIARIAAEISHTIDLTKKLIELQNELVPFANGDTTCAAMELPVWCIPAESILVAAQAFAEQKRQDDERRAKDRADVLRKELRKARGDLKDWTQDSSMATIYTFNQLPVVCRIVGGELQTSHGARVPVQDIVNTGLWAKIEASHTDKTTVDYDITVGHYRGVKLASGAMVIGCHNFAYKELARIATILNLKEGV